MYTGIEWPGSSTIRSKKVATPGMFSASVRNCSSRAPARWASATFSSGTPSCSSVVCIGADVNGDFETLKAAGATVIQEPYHPGDDESEMWIATFADPDSNYFQLVSPM